MKNVLYYVILIATFIVVDLALIFFCSFINFNPSTIILGAFLMISYLAASKAAPFVKNKLGLKNEK